MADNRPVSTLASPTLAPERPAPAAPPPQWATVVRGGRLVMHHRAAAEPEFWDRLWDLDPPRPWTGERISRWYRAPFLRHLPKEGLIVEAGCGNGNLMRTLTGAGYLVEGLDFAPRAIEANRAIDPGGRYRLGDVRRLPYEDGGLAGYLSFGVIEHFDDHTRAGILREAARCLRPGGIAVITTPYFNPLRRLRARLGCYDAGPGELAFYQYLFTRRDLEMQIRSAGLAPVRVDAYDLYKGLKDTLGIKRWLDHWNAIGPRARRWLHHPPRPMRMGACHMLMVIAEKRGPAATEG